MEPLLSKDELDALVNVASGGGGGGAGGGDGTDPPLAQRVDLAGGDRLLRALLPLLDPVQQRMADRMRAFLTPHLKAEVRARPTPASIMGPGSWPQFGGYQAVARVSTADLSLAGLMALDPVLTKVLLERSFGGKAKGDNVPSRSLSAIECRVLTPVLEQIIADMGAAFVSVTPLEFSLARVESDLRNLDVGQLGSAALAVETAIEIGELAGRMTLLLASATLEPLRPALAKRHEIPESVVRESARRIGHLIRDAQVEVSSTLGHAQLSVAQLVALRVGDLIHLDTAVGDPVSVLFEGAAKMNGRPVMSRGSLAVEITGRLGETQ